jgi:hypothetical protein
VKYAWIAKNTPGVESVPKLAARPGVAGWSNIAKAPGTGAQAV